jgi:predicted transcriptional regulator
MFGGIFISTLTIRLPDDKHERLKLLAKSNSISVNRLIDELATVALANFDAKVRFETRASRGSSARAIALLDKLDLADK